MRISGFHHKKGNFIPCGRPVTCDSRIDWNGIVSLNSQIYCCFGLIMMNLRLSFYSHVFRVLLLALPSRSTLHILRRNLNCSATFASLLLNMSIFKGTPCQIGPMDMRRIRHPAIDGARAGDVLLASVSISQPISAFIKKRIIKKRRKMLAIVCLNWKPDIHNSEQ